MKIMWKTLKNDHSLEVLLFLRGKNKLTFVFWSTTIASMLLQFHLQGSPISSSAWPPAASCTNVAATWAEPMASCLRQAKGIDIKGIAGDDGFQLAWPALHFPEPRRLNGLIKLSQKKSTTQYISIHNCNLEAVGDFGIHLQSVKKDVKKRSSYRPKKIRSI